MRKVQLISQKEDSLIEKAAYLSNLFSHYGYSLVHETWWQSPDL